MATARQPRSAADIAAILASLAELAVGVAVPGEQPGQLVGGVDRAPVQAEPAVKLHETGTLASIIPGTGCRA